MRVVGAATERVARAAVAAAVVNFMMLVFFGGFVRAGKEEDECDADEDKSKEWSEKCCDLYIRACRSCIPKHQVDLFATSVHEKKRPSCRLRMKMEKRDRGTSSTLAMYKLAASCVKAGDEQ